MLFLSVYVDDIKLAGKKQNIDPMWKVLNDEVDLGEPTSFLDHAYLVCTQRQCEISKDMVDNYRTMFESRISAGATEKITMLGNVRISSWSYDMEGHAKKCVERYCELANKTTRQLCRIDDYWNIDGSRDLSDPWAGFIQFTPLSEKPPDGYMWSGGRLTKRQATSRPDHLWPELWRGMSKNVNGADVKRSKLEGRSGILTWKWTPEYLDHVTSRPDEEMPTATAPMEIPTVPPPAPPPEEHVLEMRGQGVHAKALRIRAFWSEIGRTPRCPACETPGPGKSHTRECKTYQDAWEDSRRTASAEEAKRGIVGDPDTRPLDPSSSSKTTSVTDNENLANRMDEDNFRETNAQ